jgi:hypothetical protein
MRSVVLLVAVTACSGSSGDGAVLTIVAPDGPTDAARIELVLASADPASITTADQRTQPGSLGTEEVVYYRQRATGGALTSVPTVDGFSIRIEPFVDLVADESFIPFALVYDDTDALIAVGTVDDDAGAPAPVIIKSGVVADYVMTVQAVIPDADTGVRAGEGHAVLCESNEGAWTSGAAWKAANGSQLRLLLPDLAADPAATDATEREADLDCDDHEATEKDCDDLRTAYHADQTETCDGEDTDCDGHRLEIVEGCSLVTNACGGIGYSICSEGGSTPSSSSTCQADAQCACSAAPGNGVYCNACILDWRTSSNLTAPCAPAVGRQHAEGCPATGCTIELVQVDGPWEITLSRLEAGPFSSAKLTGVPTGDFYMRAKYLGGTTIMPTTPSIGGVYLALTNATRVIPISVDLQIKGAAASACTPTMTGTGNSQMYCP